MQLSIILGLLGGLSLFLYGMQMMSSGLEAAAGAKMKLILEKLTSNRFLGVLVGAGITAVIQSSSATTVMVVGFVNSGMMTLNQAIWIIMGANIGTTITGQLIALDVGAFAPVIAFVGVSLVVFVKNAKAHHFGQILAGWGVLFIGMGMMSSAMSPLRDSALFIKMMSSFSNPILGILAGAGITALIQSSSAAIGILQALANSGVITLGNAVYVLFGQNIGTCITAVLASLGTSRNAKRSTLMHLMFNIIGTFIFTTVCIVTPLTAAVEHFSPSNVSAQIANMHTLFNVVTTILLLPLGNYLVKIAMKILPDRPEDELNEMRLQYITPVQIGTKDGGLGTSAIYVDQLRREVERMLLMAKDNVELSFNSVMLQDDSKWEQVEKTEDYIDFLNKEISQHISKLFTYETNEKSSAIISCCFSMVGNIERIGDHAVNICGYTRLLSRLNIKFSDSAIQELKNMCDMALSSIDELMKPNVGGPGWLNEMEQLEDQNDKMTSDYRASHMNRMRSGECSDEACMIFSELLTDFERIGDHTLNIAEELTDIHQQSL